MGEARGLGAARCATAFLGTGRLGALAPVWLNTRMKTDPGFRAFLANLLYVMLPHLHEVEALADGKPVAEKAGCSSSSETLSSSSTSSWTVSRRLRCRSPRGLRLKRSISAIETEVTRAWMDAKLAERRWEAEKKRRLAADGRASDLEETLRHLEEQQRGTLSTLALEEQRNRGLEQSAWEELYKRIAAEELLAQEQERAKSLEDTLAGDHLEFQRTLAEYVSAEVEGRSLKDLEKALAEEKGKRAKAEARISELLIQTTAQQELKEKLQEAEKQQWAMWDEVQRLRAQVSVAPSHGAVWEYEDGGQWHAFSQQGSDQMHKAYLAYLRWPGRPETWRATIESAGVARKINFKRMLQSRSDTNKVRRIRVLAGVPKQWVTPAASLFQQRTDLEAVGEYYVEVEPGTPLSMCISDLLNLSGHARDSSQHCSLMQHARVKSVHRIENWRLWQGYKQRCEALRKEHASCNISVTPAELDLDEFPAAHGQRRVMTTSQDFLDCGEPLAADVDEKVLLHGTSWDSANLIIVNGFDNRVSVRGYYGDGVYFASTACKSHQYTCPKGKCKVACRCKGERTLIIARVALGDTYKTRERMPNCRRPPVRPNSYGVTYDSVAVEPGPIMRHHSGQQIHQEFVIFERDQAYPSYVVQYEL